MRDEAEIAAAADVLQAKAFSAQFRAERAELELALQRHARTLDTARMLGDSREAALTRKAMRLVEDDLRTIGRLLEAIEQRFPDAFSR